MSATVINNKFSARLASKVHRLKKMLKPVMKLLHSTKKSSKSMSMVAKQSPSSKHESYFADDSDLDQNAANEAMESRVREDIIRSCSEEGGEVSLWIDGHMTIIQGQLERVPIPVKFAYTPAGDFFWAPLPDSDICLGRAHNIHTSGQMAEKQVPTNSNLSW